MAAETQGENINKDYCIKVWYHNVHGLGNKLLYRDFFESIRGNNVFALSETFVTTENFAKYEKYFGGFTLKWTSASRKSNVGRASGGMLWGYRKTEGVSRIEWMNESGMDGIRIVTQRGILGVFPVYINCSDWENGFDRLKSSLAGTTYDDIIVMGDFNARIGEMQDINEEYESNIGNLNVCRVSEDKVTNARGRKMLDLMNESGLIVLNGRTNGDTKGSFTFLGGMGESVIDYACVSWNVSIRVRSFHVLDSCYSDHLPICLEVECGSNAMTTRPLTLLPKMRWRTTDAEAYCSRVREDMASLNDRGMRLDVNELVSIIGRSVTVRSNSRVIFKEKWYNWECERARRKSFECLRKLRTGLGRVDECKLDYRNANDEYRKVCRRRRANYMARLTERLDRVVSASEWWKVVRELKNERNVIGSRIGADMFVEYFRDMYAVRDGDVRMLFVESEIYVECLDKRVEMNEIEYVLSKLRDGKAAGEDRIPSEFYRYAPVEFRMGLLDVLNEIWMNLNVDECFNRSLVFPVFKKGDANMVNNYRGISVGNAIGKVLAGIMNERLVAWVDMYGKLNECQAGFRRGYSTIDNVFCLDSMVRLKWDDGVKKVYCFFVDFRAAFDRVDRQLLLYKLGRMGVSGRFLSVLRCLYSDTRAVVWDGLELSESFETRSGVRQGCIMSPILFALFLNDLDEFLGGGVNVGGRVIRMLAYADDIVICAESPGSLQGMIDRLYEYCVEWKMSVNLDKSEVMVMRKGGGRSAASERWTFAGDDIRVVKRYKYLGVIIRPGLNFEHCLKDRVAAARTSVNIVWTKFVSDKSISFESKMKLFNAVCRSIACYGCAIWGVNEYTVLERLNKWFVKRILGMPESTPDYVLYLETGIPTLYMYTLGCHYGYMRKVFFRMNVDRLPRFLAAEMMRRKIGWSQEWMRLSELYKCEWTIRDGMKEYNVMVADILKGESVRIMNDWILRARNSRSHGLFDVLQYVNGGAYFRKGFSIVKVGMIMRARGGMLGLNANGWRSGRERMCSMCNMEEEEDIYHFLAVCPVLSGIRMEIFNERRISVDRCVDILNGDDWDKLYVYLRKAMSVRSFLIKEFNF